MATSDRVRKLEHRRAQARFRRFYVARMGEGHPPSRVKARGGVPRADGKVDKSMARENADV